MALQDLDFARSGLRIKLIEEELVSLGYGAFKVLQERRLMFSTKEENQELDRYDEERAAEILSAKKDSGSPMGAGDGYVSSYLDGLRAAASQGKSLLPPERALQVFKANGTVAQERASVIAERARATFRSEALARYNDICFSGDADVVTVISSYAKENAGLFSNTKEFVDGRVVFTFAIGDSACMAFGLCAKSSVREGHAVLLWMPWLIELPAKKALGMRFHELESSGKPVDVRSAIDGFRIYDVSESSAELTHAFSAYVTATRVVIEHATQG
ncbi:MAG: hypothetical protein GXC75_04180 [Xanthomonadaceae bacterium]|nr:hypothetical protein [Xanthomonadaceae bacterium]